MTVTRPYSALLSKANMQTPDHAKQWQTLGVTKHDPIDRQHPDTPSNPPRRANAYQASRRLNWCKSFDLA